MIQAPWSFPDRRRLATNRDPGVLPSAGISSGTRAGTGWRCTARPTCPGRSIQGWSTKGGGGQGLLV